MSTLVKHPSRGLLSPQDIMKNLKPVSDEDSYPEVSSQITTLKIPQEGDIYVKRPKLTVYEDVEGTGLLQRLFMDEAKTLELLKKNPRPTLVRYHGCIVKRGRITGRVLQRYPMTLADRVKEGTQAFEKDSCIERIESGAKHLHSLGLAHNDLNPSNIMLDDQDHPIINDLGSCRPFGETHYGRHARMGGLRLHHLVTTA